jgi:hypothetical protein
VVPVRSGSAFLLALFLSACGGGDDSGDKLPLLPPDSSFGYISPPPFTVTIPISPIVPTHNVHLTNFSILPILPAGLVLDPATGVISGTPTQVSETTRYTVSVPDGTSAVTATLVITVNPLPSNVSHPRAANTGGAIGSRLRTSLWNATTGALIATMNRTCSPTGPCTVEGALMGPTVVMRQRNGWNTYSSSDGALIAHLDIAPGFATTWTPGIDGGYLLFAGTEGVQAITPEGTVAGDYVWFVPGSTLRVEAR